MFRALFMKCELIKSKLPWQLNLTNNEKFRANSCKNWSGCSGHLQPPTITLGKLFPPSFMWKKYTLIWYTHFITWWWKCVVSRSYGVISLLFKCNHVRGRWNIHEYLYYNIELLRKYITLEYLHKSYFYIVLLPSGVRVDIIYLTSITKAFLSLPLDNEVCFECMKQENICEH